MMIPDTSPAQLSTERTRLVIDNLGLEQGGHALPALRCPETVRCERWPRVPRGRRTMIRAMPHSVRNSPNLSGLNFSGLSSRREQSLHVRCTVPSARRHPDIELGVRDVRTIQDARHRCHRHCVC